VTAQLPLALDRGQRPALGRTDFLVGASNAAAVAWIDAWPGWPGAALVLAGPAGSGKTHLGCVWRSRNGAVSVAGEALTAELAGDLPATLVVEAADAAPERALLHLHNAVAERRGALLLIARTPPARWAVALPDLASRLAALPVASIEPPDDALIGAVLGKLFADRQLTVSPALTSYLVERMERSLEEANRLVAAIDAESLARRRPITAKLIREVLQRRQ
jgi:chromosomal replication initiation ATPase DnaA